MDIDSDEKHPDVTAQRATPVVQRDRNDHDTPPPVIVTEGSCIFEVSAEGDTLPAPANAGTNRRHYNIPPKKDSTGHPSGNIYLAHVKIVDGSGEMIFRFDNTLKQAVDVIIRDDDNDELKLSAVGTKFVVDVKRTKKIAPRSGGVVEPSMNPLKRVRFRYMNDAAGNPERRMKFVTVSIRDVILYQLDLDSLRSRGEELKVMIWWEEV